MKMLSRWLLTFLIFPLVIISVAYAQDQNTIDKHIDELKQKIGELQTQENSLSKQISILNSKITLTTLRITDTRVKIQKLTTEIDELTSEIDRLEELKTKRLELVLHRIPASYKRLHMPQFGMLFFSQSFSDFIFRIKYLLHVQEQDTLVYKQLQLTQSNYNERKQTRENKKSELEGLKMQLEQATRELDLQKREKQSLLTQTKSSEVIYQQLLAQALAENRAKNQCLIDATKIEDVKAGAPIALVGNSGYPGCSTGAHLHFEVQKNGAWVTPAVYLSSRTISDSQNGGSATIGSGNWNWPLQDPIYITQYFGKTPYSWRYGYSGGIHTGFDMISGSSQIIRAPSGGALYACSQACGRSSIIKIKYIDHGGGIISFYLHVQ